MAADGASRAPSFAIDPFEAIDPLRWQGEPVPARRWIWDDWLPVGATTAFYGDGGTGKSLLALQLLVSAATGRRFLGYAVQRVKALGIFCEDDPDELHRRLARIVEKMGIDFADLEGLSLVSRVGNENLMMTFRADSQGEVTPFYEQVATHAKTIGAQLIVIDTAADVFGGNENVRPMVRQFISSLTRLARHVDGAVVLLAHPSQFGKTTGGGDGGSTAWSNSVRSRLYLDRVKNDGGDEPDPDARRLSRMKANYARSGDVLKLRYDHGAFVGEYEGDVPLVAPDLAARNLAAETAFMAGMVDLAGKGLRVNVHRGQANHAPKTLREKTDGCSVFSEDELTAAMNRLIRANRIKSIEEGPPSRRRSFLTIVEGTLPGLE